MGLVTQNKCVPFLAAILLGLSPVLGAAELRVAVTANFFGTLQTLSALYGEETGTQITLSSGASGALYTQIVNGAPFDVFFSADAVRPERLAEEGLGIPESRFTYAQGVLVLWSRREEVVDSAGEVLHSGDFRFLAMADPRTAPYGVAAQQVMMHMGVWDELNTQRRLVRGQGVGQTYQQVASGAAELGFVALAQVRDAEGRVPGSYWMPPQMGYDPIEQQAIILKRTCEREAAERFMAWMRGPEARAVIEAAGYH
ncbi:molybdate transport system substrate-binding protein [Ectothiorhodosinus mongolicus]|uniref:Molybdate transport system substrate-binding protein n=1 Tax=Ectothiorhodosinus mongolicus TaxID=233100 RepID=A0A1R3VNT9_9GAMM|nr:molybdate ABC transporter substrate-binding protein [Ectothiorhodosinus mongolicus]ULX58046.1 molybdate ABC transporter substrate-binding protein [Ectothiorhodosinus mongolicus]SIT65615.1 molybdate transport system substrate-binding protein [Ectothiorhodosinus mongolicus]